MGSKEKRSVSRATEYCEYGFGAPLFAAVENQDFAKVKELINRGANVNLVTSIYGGHMFPLVYTPLILAAERDCLAIFEALLRVPEINVNQTNHYGGTVLHVVAGQSSTNSPRMLKLLLEREDVDVNFRDWRFGFTALHRASMHCCTETTKVLLSAEGIDVNLRDELSEYTPLRHAVSLIYPTIVKLLVQIEGIDVNVNVKGSTCLMSASRMGSVEIVKMLLDTEGVDVNAKKDEDHSTALHAASEEGHIDVVKLLLSKGGINVNARKTSGMTALREASKKGHTKIVSLILAERTDSGTFPDLYEHAICWWNRTRRLLRRIVRLRTSPW